MDLLLRMANMREEDCTPEWLASLYSEFGIIHSLAGERRGYEDDLRTRQESEKYFSFTEDNSMRQTLGEIGKPENFIAPSDPRFTSILWPLLKTTRDELRTRLDQFIACHVDMDFLSGILNGARLSNWFFQPTDNMWKPQVNYHYSTETIEDAIEIREILEPFFFGKGEQFSRVRKCQNCGLYFVAGYKGKSFCSNKCRSAYHYKVAH